MSWRDYLRPASFRGASFYVRSSDTQVGRRTKLHEYAGKDTPWLQDLGRAADKFTLEGYVIQNGDNDFNYMKERDALIKALTEKGPGTLIHPYYGELKVGLESPASISESFNEGGMATFKMSFVQSGKANILTAAPDYVSLMDTLVDYLNALGLDNCAAALETAMDAANLANDALSVLNTITGVITNIQNGISTAVAAAAGFVTELMVGINTILNAPCSLLGSIQSAARQVENIVGLGGEVVSGGILGLCSGVLRSNNEMVRLTGDTVPEDLGISICNSIISSTDYDYTELGSGQPTEEGLIARAAMSNLSKTSLFASGCRIALRIDFTSKDVMLALVEAFSTAMDNFLLELGAQTNLNNDDTYNGIEELRSMFVEYMLGKGKDLTQIENYTTPADGMNTLVLAYNKYEDITRESQIFNMNRLDIRHPGFIPGKEEIGILAK